MPKGQYLKPWEVNRLQDMIQSGYTNRQIANELRINHETVRRRRHQHNQEIAPMQNGHAEPEQDMADVAIAIYVESTDYPSIRELLHKQQRYRNMAAEAEKIGDDELSLLIMSRMELTPLEQEILRYWAETHTRE